LSAIGCGGHAGGPGGSPGGVPAGKLNVKVYVPPVQFWLELGVILVGLGGPPLKNETVYVPN
jgi:hypothetical protein